MGHNAKITQIANEAHLNFVEIVLFGTMTTIAGLCLTVAYLRDKKHSSPNR